MNNITIAGRIGNDAEIRFTQGGDPVAGFSVAVDSKVKGQKVTTWFRCSLWGKRAEALAPYLTKGSVVCLTGEVSARAYLPKGGGDPQASLEVRVGEISLHGGGQRAEGGDDGFSTPKPESRARSSAPAPAPGPAQADYDPFGDDQIPF